MSAPKIELRQNCAADGKSCYEKGPYPGETAACRDGRHVWELNFFRISAHHYHCIYCGKGEERR